MFTPNEYIVFEPDQVLSDKHLNALFDYLDQQNRWTRNKLIGAGIVCGLELAYDPGAVSVSISAGCGLTSQGYIILREQPLDAYTYFTAYDPPDDSKYDLPFDKTKVPFYKDFCAGRTIYELLTTNDHNTLIANNEDGGQLLSSVKSTLDNYMVVLFLEMTEKDLKNCDTFDCNNKGEKMLLNLRALLVPKGMVDVFPKPWTSPVKEINLARYNVPAVSNALANSDDVIDKFLAILEEPKLLDNLATAFKHCSEIYNYFVQDNVAANADKSFQTLATDLKHLLAFVKNKKPLIIQYYYDFINDLILAYYEFSLRSKDIVSECCLDESEFPLHLVLGNATSNTGQLHNDANRQYFIHTPLYANQSSYIDELGLLYQRMVKMVSYFTLWANKVAIGSAEVKITPSQYQKAALSERCIPYYYFDPSKNKSDINTAWSYHKSKNGNEDFNLGYHSSGYSSDSAVTNPLLFDIEYYNFFRIEGHIGMNYSTALGHIVSLRNSYNLPMDVVAVSADMLNTPPGDLPGCQIQDLNTDYRLLASDFLCDLLGCICKFVKMPYQADATTGRIFFADFGTAEAGATSDAGSTPADAAGMDKIQVEAAPAMYHVPAEPVPAFDFKVGAYKKGDFISSYCKIRKGSSTIGGAYLASLKNRSYVNPVAELRIFTDNSYFQVYTKIFDLIDAADKLFSYLLDHDAASFVYPTFHTAYNAYNALRQEVTDYLDGLDGEILKRFGLAAVAGNCNCNDLLCLLEKFVLLKDEYNRRIKLYDDQLRFIDYFQKHPGLEHKAGTPKGGTFVLVYHQEPGRGRTSSANAAGSIMHIGSAGTLKEKMLAETMSLSSPTSGTGTVVGTAAQSIPGTAIPEEKVAAPAGVNGIMGEMEVMGNIVDTIRNVTENPVFSFSANEKNLLNSILGKLASAPAAPAEYQIKDGSVIADFYVPYQCCSDCPPVAYFMDSKINIYSVTGGGSYCSGSAGVSVGLSGSDKNISYQLILGGKSVGLPKAGTGSLLDFGLHATVGIYSVVATDSYTGDTKAMLGSATVSVNPLPDFFVVSGGGSYCPGGAGLHVGLNGSSAGHSYQLYNGVTTVGAPLPGTGAALDFGLQTAAGTYTVLAIDTATNCSRYMTGNATIVVNQAPAVFAVTGGGGFCAGGAGVHVGLINSVAGVSYQLFLGTKAVGAPLAGAAKSLDFGLQSKAGVYTVVATDLTTGCTSNMSGNAAVVINPLPAVFTMTGGGNYAPGGSGVPVGLSGSEVGVNYQLLLGGMPVGAPVAGNGTLLPFGLFTIAGTYTATAANSATGCTASMVGNAIVKIVDVQLGDITGQGVICVGNTTQLSNTTPGGTWTSANDKVAKISSTGLVTGVKAGTSVITYTVSGKSVTKTITVNPLPNSSFIVSINPNRNIVLSGSEVGVSYQLVMGAVRMDIIEGTGGPLNFGVKTAPGTYTVVGTSHAGGCSSVMSGSAIVTPGGNILQG